MFILSQGVGATLSVSSTDNQDGEFPFKRHQGLYDPSHTRASGLRDCPFHLPDIGLSGDPPLSLAVITRRGRLAEGGIADLSNDRLQLIGSSQAGEGGNGKSVGDQELLLFEAILNHAQDGARRTDRFPLFQYSTEFRRDIFPFIGYDADQVGKTREDVLVGERNRKAVRGKTMSRRLRIWIPDSDVIPEAACRHGEHGAQLSAAQDAQDRSRLNDD